MRRQDRLDLDSVSFSGSARGGSSSNSSDESDGDVSDDTSDNFIPEDRHLVPLAAIVNLNDFPTNVQEARRKLGLISDRTTWHNRKGIQFVWQLLQSYPVLAAATFDDPYDELKYPLALLLRSKANLEVIQSVYHMYPEAISKPNGTHGDTLLHDACWYGASKDTIQFLAMEYPESLIKCNDYRRLPVHDAMRTFAAGSQTTPVAEHQAKVQMLIEMYPGSMTIRDNDGKWLLESAFHLGYDLDLLKWLAQRWPQDITSFNFTSPQSLPIDGPRSRIITNKLSHITMLRCDPYSWTLDGFVHMMTHLAQANTLEVVELMDFPGQLLIGHPEAQRAFEFFIEKARNSKLLIAFPRLENLLENFCDASLRIMVQSLQKNSRLKRLELRQMLLSHPPDLNQLLVTARSPKHIVLHQVGFQGRTERSTLQLDQINHGGIKCLDMIDCPIMPEAMDDIVHNLAWIPALTKLTLQYNPSAPLTMYLSRLNLTDAIVQLLHKNTLQQLKIDPLFPHDFDPICEALRVNTSLTLIDSETYACEKAGKNLRLFLDVLTKDNTTLQTVVGLESKGRQDIFREQILELLSLNRYGRGGVRAGDTTLPMFLEDLGRVQTASSLVLPIRKLSILNGLLREAPSLWCNI